MNIIIKYLISGGSTAIVDLLILNFLDSLGLHYLISVNIAFIFAFFMSFTLQKYWTFNDAKVTKTHHQMSVYFVVSVCNIFLNSLIIHFLLQWNIIPLHFILRPVVISQILASGLIAFESFMIYRYFIFKKDMSKKGLANNRPLKILIITQKLDANDSYFGFFYDWVLRFSSSCMSVTVITLEVGAYKLPENVKVLSLKKGSKLESLYLLWRYSITEKDNYDAVFCHMSPVYVIVGWPLWMLFDKTVALWYVHRSVDLKLKIATFLSDIIFTATPESFRIKNKKVKYMGQAVDIQRFSKPKNYDNSTDNILKIITVGRITPIKNLDILIKAISIIKTQNILVKMEIIGMPLYPSDFEYKKSLEDLIKNNNLIKEIDFVGAIANKDMPQYYWKNDICVNLAPTGGLDKTVLEAMASGIPVVIVNKAFEGHLGSFVDVLLAKEGDVEDFAEKLISLYRNKNYIEIGKTLQEKVKERSSLDNLIPSIVKNINEIL